MRYKLGDFVRFVDEKMEGYSTRIIDEQMIGVTGEDDFEIPVLASKVTYVHGYGKLVGDEEPATDAVVPTGEFKSKGVYVAVVNDAKANAVVHFYLLNETSYQLLTTVTATQQKTVKGEFAGIIEPGAAVKIYSNKLSDLQLWPKLTFRALFFSRQSQAEALEPLNVSEQFKAKDFSGAKKLVPIIKQQGWIIQLDEPELVIDAAKLKESFFKPAEEKQEVAKPKQEVDLHIEKLRDDHQFLSGSEILNIQLNAFKHALDAAIVHQMPEITFIHGTGSGTLKHELHKQLSKHPKVQTFLDARKEKFGYGATKVMLK